MFRSTVAAPVIIGILAIVFLLALGTISFSNANPDWSIDLDLTATAGAGYADLSWTTTAADVYEFHIYRGTSPDFGAFSQNLLAVVSGSTFTYRDKNVLGRRTYYYQVRAKNGSGLSNPSNEVSVTPGAVNPHDRLFYEAKTDICRTCHITHLGRGPRLLKDPGEKDLCFTCHDATGQSIYDAQGEFLKTGSTHPVEAPSANGYSLSCRNCHNPHGDWDSANARTYPRILRAPKANGSVTEYVYQGNEFCWTCHGSQSPYPGPNGDHQTFYPGNLANPDNPNLAGTGHDHPDLLPESGTGIKCAACHNQHGSNLTKLLQERIPYSYDGGETILTTEPAGNDKTFCFACHRQKRADISRADYGWDGQATYEAQTTNEQGQPQQNGHASDCKICHNPHGTENSRYLTGRYDLAYSPTRSTDYSATDYLLCFSCHRSEDLMGLTGPTTGFYNTRESDPQRRNLHYFHLKKIGDEGRGYANCKECHRPHGAIAGENPALKHRVGFPATTVSANDYNQPRFFDGSNGGSCNLRCHGREHKEDNYAYER